MSMYLSLGYKETVSWMFISQWDAHSKAPQLLPQCETFGNLYTSLKMGVFKNRGTPKSSILIGFSIVNHPFWDTTIFGSTPKCFAFPGRSENLQPAWQRALEPRCKNLVGLVGPVGLWSPEGMASTKLAGPTRREWGSLNLYCLVYWGWNFPHSPFKGQLENSTKTMVFLLIWEMMSK